jgi:hypothetical protein|tara:strand:+ start:2891 stop:3154 length:264 start_codon:yes stop_codon:yes gene_type:complete
MNEKIIYTFIGGVILVSYYMINMKKTCKKNTGIQTDTNEPIDIIIKNDDKSNYSSGIFYTSKDPNLSKSIDNSDIDWNSVTKEIQNN